MVQDSAPHFQNNECTGPGVPFVQKNRPVRMLRSEFTSLLGVRRTKIVTHGRRSFSYSSSHLSNRLSEEIKGATSQKAFRKVPITHFFKLAYS